MKKLLLLLAIFSLSNVALAQDPLPLEGFEGEDFPPENWLVVSTHPTNIWSRTVDGNLNGTGAAWVNWVAEDQNESLITPSFNLAGQPAAYLNFIVSMSYFWMVDPNENGDFTVSISTNGGLNYTDLWSEADLGTFTTFSPQIVSLDLSQYLGQSNVRVRFNYSANDAAAVYLDDVSVTSCPSIGNVALTALSDTSATIDWVSLGSNFDFEYGLADFEQGTGTLLNVADSQAVMSNLQPGTFYDFYIRTYCGAEPLLWEGPFTINTTNTSPVALNYSYDFETPNLSVAGWGRITGTDSAAWALSAVGDDPALSQDGEQFAFCPGTVGTATNSWLFSRALDLPANVQVTFNYYMRKADLGTGTSNNNRLVVRIGTAATAAGQTTTLNTHNAIAETTHTLRTATFTPTAAGAYFVGFNCLTPAQTAATAGAVLVDAFSAFVPLSVDAAAQQVVSIFPNPTTDVLNINLLDSTKATHAIVTDLTGKIIKTFKLNNDLQQSVDVSDVATGLYLLNVYTEKGTASTKFIKK